MADGMIRTPDGVAIATLIRGMQQTHENVQLVLAAIQNYVQRMAESGEWNQETSGLAGYLADCVFELEQVWPVEAVEDDHEAQRIRREWARP